MRGCRQRAQAGKVVATLLATILVAGCSTVAGIATGTVESPVGGDPVPLNRAGGQVVATGTVTTAGGAPAADATVFLLLQADPAGGVAPGPGDILAQVAVAAVTTGLDGSFAIHLEPAKVIADAAAANGGSANFQLMAFDHWPASGTPAIGFWSFPLVVSGAGFDGLPEPLAIRLQG